MGRYYRIFGEELPVELVLAMLLVVVFALFALRIRTLFFLTIVTLLLPSLSLGNIPVVKRLLRWAFLSAFVVKGVVSNLRYGLRPRPATGPHWAVFLLMFLMAASIVWSIGPELSLAKGGMMIALLAGVFLVLWNSWDGEEEMLHVANALYLLAVLLFLAQSVFVAANFRLVVFEGVRFGGIFQNPNGLGTAVAFLGPFVYWKHHTTESRNQTLLCRYIGFVMAASLVLSGSRSGMLGTLVCMGVVLTYVHRAKIALATSVILVPLVLLVLLGPSVDTTAIEESRMVRAESLSHLSDRLPLWEEGLKLSADRPFFGHGYAMSTYAVIGWADPDLAAAVLRVRGARNYHNSHLQLLLELGIVGLATFWYFLYAVVRRGLALYASPRRGPLEVAGVAYFAALLALIGDSFVHGWAFSPGSSMAIVFWLLSAAVLRCHTLATTEEEIEEDPVEEPAAEPSTALPQPWTVR